MTSSGRASSGAPCFVLPCPGTTVPSATRCSAVGIDHEPGQGYHTPGRFFRSCALEEGSGPCQLVVGCCVRRRTHDQSGGVRILGMNTRRQRSSALRRFRVSSTDDDVPGTIPWRSADDRSLRTCSSPGSHPCADAALEAAAPRPSSADHRVRCKAPCRKHPCRIQEMSILCPYSAALHHFNNSNPCRGL